jgi:predicted metal-dependent HD superfamily phosphohydrolase
MMKNRDELKAEWTDLVSHFSNDEKQIEDIFDRITQFYNSQNRYYHNLNHIGDMLTEAGNFKKMVDDYDSILFAIWFHDIIYDTKRSDNEEKSSEFA